MKTPVGLIRGYTALSTKPELFFRVISDK